MIYGHVLNRGGRGVRSPLDGTEPARRARKPGVALQDRAKVRSWHPLAPPSRRSLTLPNTGHSPAVPFIPHDDHSFPRTTVHSPQRQTIESSTSLPRWRLSGRTQRPESRCVRWQSRARGGSSTGRGLPARCVTHLAEPPAAAQNHHGQPCTGVRVLAPWTAGLPNNALQLTRGGWRRAEASWSARSS